MEKTSSLQSQKLKTQLTQLLSLALINFDQHPVLFCFVLFFTKIKLNINFEFFFMKQFESFDKI